MNESALVKSVATNVQNRHARSLYKWLSKVTGVDACWIEGTDERNHPVWGLIKRIIGNRFLVKSRRLAAASVMGASLCLVSPSANAQKLVEASTFRGQNGFTITGTNYADHFGADLAMGDINGDGFKDLVIGAFGVGPGNSNRSPGQTAVVFGSSSGFDSSLSLSSLDGMNGFVFNGPSAVAVSGTTVASDDVNGDGIDDIIIGAPGDDPVNSVYVVFGKSTGFAPSVELSTVANGTDGFILVGHTDENGTGKSIATGNFNGDSAADILIGAAQTSPNTITQAGQAYVVFGQTGAFADTLQLSALQGNDSGFVIVGNELQGTVGHSVASGDINGDGYDDVFVGGPNRYGDSYIFYGDVYVVFGKDTDLEAFTDTLNVNSLNGSNGFRLRGTVQYNSFGTEVGSGDVNGDGFDDLFVQAEGYGRDLNYNYQGEVYVLFGGNSFPAIIDDSSIFNGSNGFFFEGISDGDYLGKEFASVDLNGDGMDELITGSGYAFANPAIGAQDTGAVYIIFGFDDNSVSEFHLSSLDGSNGFVIKGKNGIGNALVTGDLNGDGFDEIISGKSITDITQGVTGTGREGEVTVFFNTINQTITGSQGFRMLSAPTHGPIFNELLEPFWTQGFIDSDYPPLTDSANVWIWNSGIQYWDLLADQTTDSLSAGNGFLFYLYEDDNFTGPGNTGFPKRISVSQFTGDGTFNSGTINPVSGLTDGDFFLAGNPFGFTIDWDSSAISKTNLSNNIYTYDHSGGVWRVWNGTTGDIGEGKIAPFQGFFIQAEGGAGGISFGEGAISDSAGIFFKQVPAEPRILKIQAEAGGLTSNAWLSFQDGGEHGRDAYDGLSLPSLNATYLSLFTVTDNNEALSINALPVDQSEELTIPLELTGSLQEEIALLSFEGLDDFEEWELVIRDRHTNQEFIIDKTQNIELALERVITKKIPEPTLPTPVAMKTKASSVRYELVLKPGVGVHTEEPASGLPESIQLKQNYPNPFNPTTAIAFGVPRAGLVRLEIFDLLGRKVSTLVDSNQPAGEYTITFDASSLSSGVYIYRLQTGGSILTKKMTLIK